MLLLLATNNPNKKKEIEPILPVSLQLKDLNDLNLDVEIPETGNSLEENALIKARYLHRLTGLNCFADDTGLEIDSLSGAPGVFSARYAGFQKKDSDNIQLVLEKLQNQSNRSAQFRTVIALIFNNTEYLFEGIIRGTITNSPRGTYGFGYDSIFIPEHYSHTFAELGEDVKLKISHRSLAIHKMIGFLESQI